MSVSTLQRKGKRVKHSEFEQFVLAIRVASEAHALQQRKSTGHAYINHPIRVAQAALRHLLPQDAVVAAVLHDVVEDTVVTLDELKQAFTPETCDLVRLLTQPYKDDASQEDKARLRPAYYAEICTSVDAACLKVLDRTDNVTEMLLCIDHMPKWVRSYLKRSQNEMGMVIPFMKGSRPDIVDEYHTAWDRVYAELVTRGLV